MKIEVCEQMLASWLKHIKGCQIEQTNWRPPPAAVSQLSDEDFQSIDAFVNEIQKFAAENNLDIFKRSTIKQMVIQCEIDVVGVRIQDGVIGDLYLIDSAFHENGLNYGDVVARVLKKILRAVFVSDTIFKSIPAKILFVSPKCGEELRGTLVKNIQTLQATLGRFYPDVETVLLFNEDFTKTVYRPLLEKVDCISDDNDLFIRNLKLCNTAQKFESHEPNQSFSSPDSVVIDNAVYTYKDLTRTVSPRIVSERKTPKGGNMNVVFGVLYGLIDKGRMTESVVQDLQSLTFSKRQFSLSSFPVLIPAVKLNSSGYEECRFYKNNPIEILNVRYYVCSQWIPNRIRRLQAWYETMLQT